MEHYFIDPLMQNSIFSYLSKFKQRCHTNRLYKTNYLQLTFIQQIIQFK
jgi:hypothetical protein